MFCFTPYSCTTPYTFSPSPSTHWTYVICSVLLLTPVLHHTPLPPPLHTLNIRDMFCFTPNYCSTPHTHTLHTLNIRNMFCFTPNYCITPYTLPPPSTHWTFGICSVLLLTTVLHHIPPSLPHSKHMLYVLSNFLYYWFTPSSLEYYRRPHQPSHWRSIYDPPP